MSISCFGDAVNRQIRSKAIQDIIADVDFINDKSRQITLDALIGSNLTVEQIRETYLKIVKLLEESKSAKSQLPYK
jgi:hypothetical protein